MDTVDQKRSDKGLSKSPNKRLLKGKVVGNGDAVVSGKSEIDDDAASLGSLRSTTDSVSVQADTAEDEEETVCVLIKILICVVKEFVLGN